MANYAYNSKTWYYERTDWGSDTFTSKSWTTTTVWGGKVTTTTSKNSWTSWSTTWSSSKSWTSWSSSNSWTSWGSSSSYSWGSSSSGSSSKSGSSWANWTYRWAGWTWLTDTDWWAKYWNNSTIQSMIQKYWQNNVYDALDYISGWWSSKSQINYLLSWGWSTDLKSNNTVNYNANGSQLKSGSSSNSNKSPLSESQVISTLSNMKFWKDVNKWYDMTSRNSQIADTMKQMWLDIKDASSVQDFLEKYSQSYAAASDNDKKNTANKIFELYSNYQPTTDNNSPINDVSVEQEEESAWTDFDELLWEILWEEEAETPSDESPINDVEEDEDTYEMDEDTKRYISWLEEQIESLNGQLDSLNNNKVEPYDAEKAAKEARQAALEEWSAAAWWRASWEWEAQEAAPQVNEGEQALTSTANYWTYWDKIMNSLSRLWYQLDSWDTNVNEWNMNAVLSWWEPEVSAEEQSEIAQAEWAVIPEFSNPSELINNYVWEIDKIAEMGPSKENVERALKVYLDAKDAAAYYVAHNRWSNQEYNDMLRQIKKNPKFINLLSNFRWWWMNR